MKKQTSDHTKSDIEISSLYADYIPEFIVQGLIKRFGINILAAERGAGKTRFMLWYAYSIIYGCADTLGYPIKIFGDVLFVNLELAEKELKSFFEPIKNYFEKELRLKPKHNLNIMTFKGKNVEICDILKSVAEYHPLLTIIDNYKLFQYSILQSQPGTRDITNSNFAMVLKPLNEIIDLYGTTVLLINHTNKGTRYSPSSADLMFGPGALPDLVDQVSLLRKTSQPNQRIIVPDKSRYSAEGLITTNLVSLESSDDASPIPEWLKFELIESNVDEFDHLPSLTESNRISKKQKTEVIQFMKQKLGTMEECAEKILGDGKKKGTVSKIIKKYTESLLNP